MSNTIVLFRSKLDTLNVFTDQMQKEFLILGYDVYLVDLEQSIQSLGALYAYMQEHPILAMIGFNSTFFGIKTESGHKIWEELNIPCINILVDHPYWYRDILLDTPRNSAILCIDYNHMNYVSRFYPDIAISGFLPHGGTELLGIIRRIEDREIDVFYAGSLYLDYVEVQKTNFSNWNFDAEQICEKTIQYLLEHRDVPIESALEYELKQQGVNLSEEQLCKFVSSCVYIERVVSSHFREEILRCIAEAGIELTIYGHGWEKCDWIHLPNVHFHGLISPEKVLEKMEDSKIVLNTLPWFKKGSHERVFNGMLRGCVVVSENTDYFREVIPADAWCSFTLDQQDINELPNKIKDILHHPDQAQRIADRGLEVAKKSHTWQCRAREIHEDLLQYL